MDGLSSIQILWDFGHFFKFAKPLNTRRRLASDTQFLDLSFPVSNLL